MDLFYNKVLKTETCWLWLGRKNDKGYGRTFINNKEYKAHRYSYMINKGEIPEGMFVCHTCDNPSCVNPDHLFLGTDHDNKVDGVKKGRPMVFYKGYKQHPSLSAYMGGCRCVECKAITSEYHRKRYQESKKKK